MCSDFGVVCEVGFGDVMCCEGGWYCVFGIDFVGGVVDDLGYVIVV